MNNTVVNNAAKPDFTTLASQISENDGAVLENLIREDILLEDLGRALGSLTRDLTAQVAHQITDKGDIEKRLNTLQGAIDIFIDVIKRRVTVNAARVKQGLLNSLDMVKDLERGSIDTEMLENLTRVLKKIILSRENVMSWQAHSETILQDLYAIYPFDIFYNIFENKKSALEAHIFFMKDLEEPQKLYLHYVLKKSLLAHFQVEDIVENMAVEFLEKDLFPLCSKKVQKGKLFLTKQDFLTDTPGIGGILGVALFSDKDIPDRDKDILNAFLSIMTLVTGSSRALSNAIRDLEFYAGHDPLTGLYNRRMFEHFLTYEISRVKRKNYTFSLLMQDLDDFKYVNDNYGHPFGDLFLKEVAGELTALLRDGDVIARLGGDEFAVILSETELSSGRIVADKIRNAFAMKKIVTPDDKVIPIKASIGLVEFPTHGSTQDELMIVVDAALYKAKELGKNKVFVPTPDEIKESLKDQTTKFNLIQDGIAQKRFVPFYQPIFDIATGTIFGYEALARFREQNGQIIPAFKFIEMAERLGKIFDIDRLIIQTAFEKKKKEGNRALLFVNLSGKELKDDAFLDFLVGAARSVHLDTSEIVLEITEREAAGDIAQIQKFTTKMLAHGFKLAIDDFGSGYSSFYYIKYIPVDIVKIDGEFIKELASGDVRDLAFVESIQTLCAKLGIKTLAEFIESEKILEILRAIGIDYGQGYHLGMPQENFLD